MPKPQFTRSLSKIVSNKQCWVWLLMRGETAGCSYVIKKQCRKKYFCYNRINNHYFVNINMNISKILLICFCALSLVACATKISGPEAFKNYTAKQILADGEKDHFSLKYRDTLTSPIRTGTSTSGPMTAAKATPLPIPKTDTATAMASSKLLLAAVKERVADTG